MALPVMWRSGHCARLSNFELLHSSMHSSTRSSGCQLHCRWSHCGPSHSVSRPVSRLVSLSLSRARHTKRSKVSSTKAQTLSLGLMGVIEMA